MVRTGERQLTAEDAARQYRNQRQNLSTPGERSKQREDEEIKKLTTEATGEKRRSQKKIGKSKSQKSS